MFYFILKMPNYKRGKIYILISNNCQKIYIGSTCQPLNIRLSDHKKEYNRYITGKYRAVGIAGKKRQNYSTSYILFGEGPADVKIELYEDYPCDNVLELENRESEIIKKMWDECVNKNIPRRTKKQYRIDTGWHEKQRLRLVEDEEYANRKRESCRRSYHKMKVKYNAARRIKNNCPCGGKFTNGNKAVHQRTKKHKKYLEEFGTFSLPS